ncbi:869_t:CDS:2, partial [Ambispora leptoticha]
KTKLVPLTVIARGVELTKENQFTKVAEQEAITILGKILVANSLILARIWYAAYLLPPNRKQVAEINRLITIWIKSNFRMLPRYATFQLPYEHGGLQAPIVNNMLDARMLMVWTRLTT